MKGQELIIYQNIVQISRQNSDLMLGRWWKAGITGSPSVGVEIQIETVRSAMRLVIQEANAIMSQRVEIVAKDITCKFTKPALTSLPSS
jgi:hypothetical protein